MTVSNWITLAIFAFTQLTALMVVYINVRIKLKELEMKISEIEKETDKNRKSFHIHEMQNEKMFDKFEKKIDNVNTGINELKTILISKLN